MPVRLLRFLAGHYYHLYNRGVNYEAIFFSPDNYTYLLRLLKKRLVCYPMAVIAYCLMPNHYHFLVKLEQDDTLPQLMRGLFGAYVQALNRQQSRQGPLFQGRFRAIMVDEDAYLTHLARYIHANPVVAGLVATPEAWAYSNYQEVVGLRAGTLCDDTLVPGYFPTGQAYREFVEDYVAERREVAGLERYLLV